MSEKGTTTKGSVPATPSSERTRLRATRLRAVSAFGLVAVLLAVLVTADRCRRGTGPAEANASARVRTPIATGQYYPGEPEALKAELKRCLSAADAAAAAPKPEGELIALIVPHSAYKLCGVVAADAYRLLEGKHYDTVVIVGPSHMTPFEGVALSENDIWRTPLGDVTVDGSVGEALRARGVDVRFAPDAERTERSIEVELPFLQEMLTDFKIAPLLMRDSSRPNALTLAAALADWGRGRSVLFVASSELGQFMPRAAAAEIDRQTLAAIQTLDVEEVARTTARLGAKFVPSLASVTCGEGPLMAVLATALLLGGDRAVVLGYTNSEEVSGGAADQVFGYGAVAIYRSRAPVGEPGRSDRPELTARHQKRLLEAARGAVEAEVQGRRTTAETPETDERLAAPAAAFVTLWKGGQLRGSCQSLDDSKALIETVREHAAAAARDPRFPRPKETDLGDLEIRIQVLSPLRKIEEPREIDLLREGVVVVAGGQRNFFLPEVARDTGWSREKLLSRLCEDKMGLSPNAWREGASIYAFTVQEIRSGRPATAGG